jgi:hypothetical protein
VTARRRPDTVFADGAYDHDKYRWVVEQVHWFPRLRIRREIRDDIHEAFLRLACAIICFRRMVNLHGRLKGVR